MKRLIPAFVVAIMFAIAAGGTAMADHDHDLITPGTTVVDIAGGNTENCLGEPAYHVFHVKVHTGTPGQFAFAQANNPVAVEKTEDFSC